jgi:membrane protein DedA with SNARE-associated domain
MSIESIAEAIVEFVKAREAWAAPIVFLLAFGESIAFVSLILPFWGMLVAIGALIAGAPAQFVAIWIAASVGAALGDWFSYWLGYHYHDRIAKMWPLSRYPDLLPQGHAFFEKYGAWAIVLARFSGPFRASVPIVAGAAEMNWVTFQIANWGSAFLWALVLLLFGDILSQAFHFVSRWFG